MKSFLSRVLLAVSISFLAGCAITPPTTSTENKAARLSTTVSTPLIDGVAVTAVVLDFQEIDPKTGQNTGLWKRSVHVFNSLPTLAEIAKGATAGMGAAIIQGEALKDATKLSKCADGANCGTVINSVANSGSASQSTSQQSSTIGVTTGGSYGAAYAPKHAN